MRTREKMKMVMLAFSLTGLLLAGCTKDTVKPTNTNYAIAPYYLYMTDAAGPYQQVNVNIIGASVLSDKMGWTPLSIHAGIYNLLQFTNGTDTLLANGLVAAGRVSQVRLELSNTGNSVMVNNTLYPLETPSGEQSGLKINVGAVLLPNIVYKLLLDFDAGQSVVQTGEGTYILKPVIRAVTTPATGAIKGQVLPLSGYVSITAATPLLPEVGTYTNLPGHFLLQGLYEGSYQVTVTPPPPYALAVFNNVMVSTGAITDMGAIVIH